MVKWRNTGVLSENLETFSYNLLSCHLVLAHLFIIPSWSLKHGHETELGSGESEMSRTQLLSSKISWSNGGSRTRSQHFWSLTFCVGDRMSEKEWRTFPHTLLGISPICVLTSACHVGPQWHSLPASHTPANRHPWDADRSSLGCSGFLHPLPDFHHWQPHHPCFGDSRAFSTPTHVLLPLYALSQWSGSVLLYTSHCACYLLLQLSSCWLWCLLGSDVLHSYFLFHGVRHTAGHELWSFCGYLWPIALCNCAHQQSHLGYGPGHPCQKFHHSLPFPLSGETTALLQRQCFTSLILPPSRSHESGMCRYPC